MFTFAQDQNGCIGFKADTINVGCQTPILNVGPNITLAANQTISGGAVWSNTFGNVTATMSGQPMGININSTTGAYTGSSGAIGVSTATVTITDKNNCQQTGSFTIDVQCSNILLFEWGMDTIWNGQKCDGYFAAFGGNPNYTYSVTSGTPPAGLFFLPSGYWMPTTFATTAGVYLYAVTATDANNCSVTVFFTTVVLNPQPILLAVNPDNTVQNSVGMNVALSGQHFSPPMTGTYDDSTRMVTFMDSTNATMALLASDFLNAGNHIIQLQAPGALPSGLMQFTVTQAPPPATQIVVLTGVYCGPDGANWPSDTALVLYNYNSTEFTAITTLVDTVPITLATPPAGAPITRVPGSGAYSVTVSGLDTSNRYYIGFKFQTPTMPGAGLSNQDSSCWSFVSVGDIKGGTKGLFVNPNPFSDRAQVTCDLKRGTVILLYPITGKEVLRKEVIDGYAEIERGDLPSGFYVLCVLNDKQHRVGYRKVTVH